MMYGQKYVEYFVKRKVETIKLVDVIQKRESSLKKTTKPKVVPTLVFLKAQSEHVEVLEEGSCQEVQQTIQGENR
jgi:hypothetical protein